MQRRFSIHATTAQLRNSPQNALFSAQYDVSMRSAHGTETASREEIVFLCTGNICRSAFADVVARTLSDRFVFSSCGTYAEVGRGLDAGMRAAADPRYASAQHVSRQAYGRDLVSAALIVCFGLEHVAWLAEEEPSLTQKAVPFGALERLAAEGLPKTIAELLAENRCEDAQPGDWVADPWMQSPGVYARTVQRIAGGLESALPLLRESS